MRLFASLIAGLVFGLGLILSGMSNPAKVLGFLDLAGRWDPSLIFVMAGAILVSLLGFRFATRRTVSLLGEPMRMPTASQVDTRLILGSLTFGAGWGLAGFCPGPAVASLLSGFVEPLIFVAAMVAGMGLFELLERRRTADR